MQAAAAMDPAAREAMIEGMVDGLARRLEADGGTADEWLRLVRSYKALGREGEARDAVEAALEALPENERAALTGAAEVRALLQDQ
jgi:cytochrome c-type biogenesis protein CcmH